MAIIRRYETKGECVGLLVDEMFNAVDSTLITETPEWYEHWDFVSEYDENDYEDPDDVMWFDEDEGLVFYESNLSWNGAPAWNTWFEPVGYLYDWCRRNLRKVTECGFVAIFHDNEFWGLGVDGAGYSFRDAHFTPLYDALGFKWHE